MSAPDGFMELKDIHPGDLSLAVTMAGMRGTLTAKDVTVFLRSLPPVYDPEEYRRSGGLLVRPTGPMAETWIRINSTYTVGMEPQE